MQSNFKKSHSEANVMKPKKANRGSSNDSTQLLISNSKNSQSAGNIPIYYLNYDFQNGIVVRMPVIYEYHLVLPPGIDRAIPLPNNKGFLVPFSIFVQSSGRFVYNPAILRRHPSLLSHIRLARQRGITLEPIPLKRDTNTIQELSSFLNTRSHRFDDIIFENNMAADQLHSVFPLEGQDPAPQLHFLGSGHGTIQSNAQNIVNEKFHSFGKIHNQNRLQTVEKGFILPNKIGHINLQNPKSITLNSSSIPRLDQGKINLQLQNVRVISNRDFLHKKSNIKKTFHPNWIPDLDLFRMITNGQPFLENQLSFSKLKSNFHKTGKSSNVDLHNVLSTIPLDSKFDLKTNNLDRPLPDIPGPLSLRKAANSQNPLLQFAGLRKGPVIFPSTRASSEGITNTLNGSLQFHRNGMVQYPENSVAIPSGGFVFNVTKSINGSPTVKNNQRFLDPELPNIIIPNDPPLDQQQKVTLNLKEMSVRKLIPQEMAVAKLNQKQLNTSEGKVGLSTSTILVNPVKLSSSDTSKTLSNVVDRVGANVESIGVIRPSTSQVHTSIGHIGSRTSKSPEISFGNIGSEHQFQATI
ncbi:uncharacterized protein LOC133194782 [Saccostrea echinata]|uniref:uncharacterized protein LOC133194782 n=1 Tax=Saccostrea echinata TaxID=191078 RepID=UPI002A81CDC6|nr:uncharacterized protein LOC133194782 [Saccostrea echinata]